MQTLVTASIGGKVPLDVEASDTVGKVKDQRAGPGDLREGIAEESEALAMQQRILRQIGLNLGTHIHRSWRVSAPRSADNDNEAAADGDDQSVRVESLIKDLINSLQSTGHCRVASSVRVETSEDSDVLPS